MAPRRKGFFEDIPGADGLGLTQAVNSVSRNIQSVLPRGIGGGKSEISVRPQSTGQNNTWSKALLSGPTNRTSPTNNFSSFLSNAPSVGKRGGGFIGTGFGSGGPVLGPQMQQWNPNNIFGSRFTTHEPQGSEFLRQQAQGPAGTVTGGDPGSANPDRISGVLQHKDLLQRVAQESGVPWEVLASIMAIESGGKNLGTNPAGATGLMQVVGSIWQSTANQYGGDLNDPYTNVRTAAEVLKTFMQQYGQGSWERAAAAYFGGGGAFNKDGTYSQAADMYGTDIPAYVNAFRNNYSAFTSQGNYTGGGAASAQAERAINFAKQAVGTKYVWGGESYEEGGFDCSGLVYAMYRSAGKPIQRDTAQGYANSSQRVGRNEMQPGDLIFYSFGGGEVDHVAIYIGNGQIIQASSNGGDVHIRSVNEPWYQKHETGYGRL